MLLQITEIASKDPDIANWVIIIGTPLFLAILSTLTYFLRIGIKKFEEVYQWAKGAEAVIKDLKEEQDRLRTDQAQNLQWYYALAGKVEGMATKEWVMDWTSKGFQRKEQ